MFICNFLFYFLFLSIFKAIKLVQFCCKLKKSKFLLMVLDILRFYGAVFMYKESLVVKFIIFIVILSSFTAIKLI